MTTIVSSTSWSGIRFICRQEAFVDHPYFDPEPRLSIGFGSQTPLVHPSDTITIEAAIARVREHVRKNDEWLRPRIKVPVLQHEWDAISSLIYQKWAAGHDVLFKLNGGDPCWPDEFIQWNQNSKGEKKRGLSKRRAREIELAYDADYGDISQYQVFDGVPLVLKEMRPFPAEEALA